MDNEINVNANFIRRGTVRIPAKVLARLELFGETAGSYEYGMLLSAEIDHATWTATIDPDIFEIPEQEVSGAHVQFLDFPDDMYENLWGERCFNVAVHRHPPSCSTFSGEDEEKINRFFEISFLYQRGFKTPKCIMNRKEDNYNYTQLEADIEVIDGHIHVESIPVKYSYPTDYHNEFHLGHRHQPISKKNKDYQQFTYYERIHVLDEYEQLKAEILATEPDMAPEKLKEKLKTYGGFYSPIKRQYSLVKVPESSSTVIESENEEIIWP